MLSPIAWRTPTRHYGPWEKVTSLLTKALVDLGHDVTLFATRDSHTKAALHDPKDPARILGVSDQWILQPEDPWEQTGYVPNVVFTCGAVPEKNGTVNIYWGAADTVMCAGTAKIADLVSLCLNSSRPPQA